MVCLRRLALLGILVIPLPVAGQEATEDSAEAAPDEVDVEGARFLFRQGLELIEQEDWSRAADRFRTARRMRPSAALEYHLALCLFHLGQLNEAEELIVGLRNAADAPDGLTTKASALERRIPAAGGQLLIGVDGSARGVEVFLDDRPIPTSRLGAPMTTSLGAHVVEARRETDVVAREDVTVSRDQTAEVVLHLEAGGQSALEGGIGDGANGASPADDGSLFGDYRFWLGVGGGVAIIAAVIIIAVVASNSRGVEAPIVGSFQPGVLVWD